MSTRYSSAVYRAGGIPVALAAPLDGQAGADGVDDMLGTVDALLFTGGPAARRFLCGIAGLPCFR
jgi:hypothetical protein